MADTIFDVPMASPTYNPENDTIMIHNLSQPAGSSTVQIRITELLNKFVLTDGKVKVRLIDNGENSIPFITGNVFTVAFNEIVIFKETLSKNDFDQIDGFKLYMFTRGKGKYRRAGFTDPTALPVAFSDFIEIRKSVYGDEVYPGYPPSGFPYNLGMLTWASPTEFNPPNHQTVTRYLDRIFHDTLSLLDTPSIDLTWGALGDEENRVINPTRNWIDLDGNPQQYIFGETENLAINKLGIKFNYWECFQRYIDNGGVVELLIYRRRYKKRTSDFGSESTITKRKPTRWALNKKAENFGGKHKILITQEKDFYDFHQEFLVKSDGNQRSYIDGGTNPTLGNKIRREWLGFAIRYSMPAYPLFEKITPIIKTIAITKNKGVVSPNFPTTTAGADYSVIGYKY